MHVVELVQAPQPVKHVAQDVTPLDDVDTYCPVPHELMTHAPYCVSVVADDGAQVYPV